jgi:hypothetical protein
MVPFSTAFAGENNFSENDEELSEVTVRASRVANTQPAGTFASLATALRFDPQTELQSRGLPEGQADVAVRGGIFENTGFAVGATTVIDPQTGHYTAGLPIDPGFLSAPGLLTGIDNALTGFNSNIATIAYSLPMIRNGGDVLLGIGDNNLRYSSLRLSILKILKSGHELGIAVAAAFSEGDGTLPNGDFDFTRYNMRIQHRQGNAQTDVLVSYQDKFYAWPGAYTGFASLAETDQTKTQLMLANHRRDLDEGWFELSAYYRKLEDDYDFDRTTQESGVPGAFEHATRAYAVGFQGSHRSGLIDWRYGGQLTGDKLLRSTDLTEGEFTSRHYAKFSLVPSIDFAQFGNRTVTARIGPTLDSSNRDSDAVSPVAGIALRTTSSTGSSYYVLEYASTSQLPGYTAFLASAALAWEPAKIRGLGLTLTADNLTDSDYQFFPGTPAIGRQVSMSASYSW